MSPHFTLTPRGLSHLLFGTLLSLALTSTTYGMDTQGAIDGISRLQELVKNLKSSSGQFTQYRVTKDSKGGAKLGQKSGGVFEFLKPGRFIWNYQTPYQQLLQSDGQFFYIYDKDLKQATRQALKQGLGFGEAIDASPAGILFIGLSSLNEHFTLKNVIDKNDGLVWVEALPKKIGQFTRIGIGISTSISTATNASGGGLKNDPKNDTIAIMELYDSFGQATLLQFSEVRINPSLSTGQFKFIAPKGVEVIDNPLN